MNRKICFVAMFFLFFSPLLYAGSGEVSNPTIHPQLVLSYEVALGISALVLSFAFIILIIRPYKNTPIARIKFPIEDFRNLELDELKFIFDQAEKRLKDAKDSDHLIQMRTAGYMAAIAALLVVVLKLIIDQSASIIVVFLKDKVTFISVLILFGILLWILYYLISNFFQNGFYYIGNPPKWYFETIKNRDKSLIKEMIINDLESYQIRIDAFWLSYDRRYNNLNFSVKILKWLLVTIFIFIFAGSLKMFYAMLIFKYPQTNVFHLKTN